MPTHRCREASHAEREYGRRDGPVPPESQRTEGAGSPGAAEQGPGKPDLVELDHQPRVADVPGLLAILQHEAQLGRHR